MSKYSDKVKRRAEEAAAAEAREKAARKRPAAAKARAPSHEVVPIGTLPKSVQAALVAAGRFIEAVENCKDDFKAYANSQKGWTKTVALGARLAMIAAQNKATGAIAKAAPIIAKAEEVATT